MELLTRNEFRAAVFKRDGNLCVICKAPAQDAHHIIERRLWTDGGYYLDNGASLCGRCHLKAEQTLIDCDHIRYSAGIKKVILPEHCYDDVRYDKWGNPILENGQRLKGELFHDESVQKILKEGNVLDEFTKYVKYPRTYHLPWSLGVGKDDRVLKDMSSFENIDVVVTEKMDGENTTMYSDYIHARSLDSRHHPSRSWVKQLHSAIRHEIPDGWRLCGENLYAKHSIHYDCLKSYFLLFSVWNNKNECLSWDDTKEWAKLLELNTVPVIYDWKYSEEDIKEVYQDYRRFCSGDSEGYVIRHADKFNYSQFKYKVGKYVRANHVQTHGHWMREQMVLNNLNVAARS
jgi:hypothetical protein